MFDSMGVIRSAHLVAGGKANIAHFNMPHRKKGTIWKTCSKLSETEDWKITCKPRYSSILRFVGYLSENQRHPICYVQRHHRMLSIMSTDAESSSLSATRVPQRASQPLGHDAPSSSTMLTKAKDMTRLSELINSERSVFSPTR
ncbi:hypothetical protein KIN20_037379 [Parelaphostrongylus tenuis]|uniref:Uncharacterized protein n=1 Tax=Parelaphostrongylus tenuis TaxID=148309 RepID=A0AAD5WL94_PARTN|nr:hypothetical protein KIN20_037379 [Parelaphostrongylus tenuis]